MKYVKRLFWLCIFMQINFWFAAYEDLAGINIRPGWSSMFLTWANTLTIVIYLNISKAYSK